jgi:hypothetical protein
MRHVAHTPLIHGVRKRRLRENLKPQITRRSNTRIPCKARENFGYNGKAPFWESCVRRVLQNVCLVSSLCSFEQFIFPVSCFGLFSSATPKDSPRRLPRPRHLVASRAGGAPCPAPTTTPASPSPSTAATTPALAALSPRPCSPRLASPRRASELGVRPSKEFWSPQPAASVCPEAFMAVRPLATARQPERETVLADS